MIPFFLNFAVLNVVLSHGRNENAGLNFVPSQPADLTMRRLIIALVLTLPSLSHATPLSQSETQDLVRRIQTVNKSKPSIQASFTEERHTTILKEPVRNEGKIWAVLPDKIRREIGGKTPSATVIDGKKMVVYYPNLKEEEVYDLEKRPRLKDSLRALTAGLDFQQLNNFYNVEASKEGDTYRITLTPKTAAVSKVVKWVRLTTNQDLFPSQVELETAHGDTVAIRYSNVSHKSLPDSMFQLTAPPGTKVRQPLAPGGRAL
jgi:outer membrane lipoprotein-sorting protein